MKLLDTDKFEFKLDRRLRYTALFWLFFLGSIAGFVLEGLWRIILVGHWENHSATVWGPFCIVYGIGGVTMFTVACFIDKKPFFVQFGVYAVIGSVVEYIASVFQEYVFGSRSWDYSDHLLNLHGRITLQMTLIWGVLGVLFVKLFFPIIVRLQDVPEGKVARVICAVATVFMVVNLCVTAAAVLRWQGRIEGRLAENRIDRLLDERFGNDRMTAIFSNMVFVDSAADVSEGEAA